MKKLFLGILAFFLMTSVSWSATHTDWVDGTLRNPISQKVIEINDYMRIYKHEINFAAQTLDAGNADVGQIILLPKNTMVLKAWIRVVTACPTSTSVDLGYGSDVDYFGNSLRLDSTGIVGTKIMSTATTWDPSSISDGDEESKNVVVTNSATGDIVTFVFGEIEDLQLTGFNNSDSVLTITAVLSNSTGGSIDLPSGTLVGYVDKAPLEGVPLLLATSDTIDIKATTDIADVNISSGVIEVNVLVMSTAASGFPQ